MKDLIVAGNIIIIIIIKGKIVLVLKHYTMKTYGGVDV
jgi:hypothetical protein